MILTDISLRRPVFATVTILALVVMGVVSFFSLNIDDWPDVEFAYVTVTVPYKGASPEQVETKVIHKLEEAVSSISGVKHIYSTAEEGVGYTSVEFTLETSAAAATQEVRDKIGRIRGDLPEGVDEPVIMRFDPTELPIVSVVVTGGQSIRELTTLVDEVIKRRLETVDGVGQVTVAGGRKREIAIDLARDKIAAYGLTVPEIVDSLRAENMEVPGGKLVRGNREMPMRTAANLLSAQDFLDIPVGRRDGVQLFVRNIATVTDGAEECKSIATLNGQPAVGLDIVKQSGTNTVKVADGIKKALADMKRELPPGVEVSLARDNSTEIRESVNDVLFNLIIGGILAVLIVFLFLGNWRSTLISALAIPASIIATFFAMKLLGFTINNMSLMALSLAVGLLIDDAIVVIENIVRHMELGKEQRQAALDGTREIGLAVTATTLTLVAVFVPVGMMTGVVGQFFRQFGLTVAFSVLVSLLVAFTLTPMLAARFLAISQGQKGNWLGIIIEGWNRFFDRLTLRYGAFLAGALHNRARVMAVAAALFLCSLGLLPFLGSGFLGRTDNGQFSVKADVDPGMSVNGAAELAGRMDEVLRAVPEVKLTYSVAKADTIDIFVKLSDKGDRSRGIEEIMASVREGLQAFPGARTSLVQKAGLDEGKPVELMIRGESLDVLGDIEDKAWQCMKGIPGAADITSSYRPGKPDVRLEVRRDLAAELGVSAAAVADTVRTMFNGVTVSQFKDGDKCYDVRVRLGADSRSSIEDLGGVYLPGRYPDNRNNAALIPLSQVTKVVYATGPAEIRRMDRKKEITLTANLVGGVSLGEFNAALKKELDKIALPEGYGFAFHGETERMDETAGGIVLALSLGVIFIFFVLAAQFESYIDPFSIMFSLPLAIIGAIAGLFVMRSQFDIMSQIGIIMLMGLVTKNAILLIDFAKQRRSEGLERNAALIEAARARMRPIMMTTAAMVFGMLPLAVGFGPGAEGRAPMAHAIIGGLVTSTLLTLVVAPVIYTLLDDMKYGTGKVGAFFKNSGFYPRKKGKTGFVKNILKKY